LDRSSSGWPKRYTRPLPYSFAKVTTNPNFLPKKPNIAPLALRACQPVAAMITSIVAPSGAWKHRDQHRLFGAHILGRRFRRVCFRGAFADDGQLLDHHLFNPDGQQASFGHHQRRAVATAGFAPALFALAQVGVDLLQPAAHHHLGDRHLRRRPGQPLRQRHGDVIGALHHGSQDDGLGSGECLVMVVSYCWSWSASHAAVMAYCSIWWRQAGSSCMFALAEIAVGDLAQEAVVVVQDANIAPVDLVGMSVKWSSLRAVNRASIASIWNLVVI
jgi:hypothetical protein